MCVHVQYREVQNTVDMLEALPVMSSAAYIHPTVHNALWGGVLYALCARMAFPTSLNAHSLLILPHSKKNIEIDSVHIVKILFSTSRLLYGLSFAL